MRAARRVEHLISNLRSEEAEGSGAQYEDPTSRHRRAASSGRRDVVEDATLSTTSPSLPDPEDSRDSTTASSDAGGLPHGLLSSEAAALAAAEAEQRSRAAALELQVATLLKEAEAAATAHAQEKSRLEEVVASLRSTAERGLDEVRERQTRVELVAPQLSTELQRAKDQLVTLQVTEGRYADAKAVPFERRSVTEQVVVAVWERLQQNRDQEESLRQERDTAREALQRASNEVESTAREAQRAATGHAVERKAVEREAASLASRNERLEKELEDAVVQVEVLTAKGSLYDEVRSKLDGLEAASSAWTTERTVLTARLKVAEDERERLLAALKDQEHTNHLLSLDKAYLSRQVSSLQESLSKAEAECDRQHEKLREVKRARQELLDRILKDKDTQQGSYEQRLQAEVAKIEERARQDLDLIRRESADASDRENRALRDMRDAAVAESERCTCQLREQQAVYEDLHSKYHELQKTADAVQADLRAELRVKAFELDRTTLVKDEARSHVKQLRLENEMLNAKIKVLSDNYHGLDADLGKQLAEARSELVLCRERVAHYEMLEKDLDEAIVSSVGGGSEETVAVGWLERLGTAVPTAVRRRIEHGVQLARRCMQLQKERDRVAQDKEKAEKKAGAMEGELAKARAQLQHMQQPQSLLVESITRCEGELRQTKEENGGLRDVIRRQDSEKERMRTELRTLRNDIRQVLEERTALDNMRFVITTSAAAGAGASRPGAGGARLDKMAIIGSVDDGPEPNEEPYQRKRPAQVVCQGEGEPVEPPPAAALKREWYQRLATRRPAGLAPTAPLGRP